MDIGIKRGDRGLKRGVIIFKDTFNNFSVISMQSVLLVKESIGS